MSPIRRIVSEQFVTLADAKKMRGVKGLIARRLTMEHDGTTQIIEALEQREEDALQRIREKAEEFGLLPQIVAAVIAYSGLGEMDDESRAFVLAQYNAMVKTMQEGFIAQFTEQYGHAPPAVPDMPDLSM